MRSTEKKGTGGKPVPSEIEITAQQAQELPEAWPPQVQALLARELERLLRAQAGQAWLALAAPEPLVRERLPVRAAPEQVRALGQLVQVQAAQPLAPPRIQPEPQAWALRVSQQRVLPGLAPVRAA